MSNSGQVGSFRDCDIDTVMDKLPAELQHLLTTKLSVFGAMEGEEFIATGMENGNNSIGNSAAEKKMQQLSEKLISLDTNSKALLNHGAFGRSYDIVRELQKQLIVFSEESPDEFYDQLCLPLVRRSLNTVKAFFQTQNAFFMPNTTIAMKCVVERFIRENPKQRLAYLPPIYGATRKLLEYFEDTLEIVDVTNSIDPTLLLFEESPDVLLNYLNCSYAKSPFSMLLTDAVASQSGRILPVKEIGDWCRSKGVKLVVDGTQSVLDFMEGRPMTDFCDYFVMSTHKWSGNVKTCGIVVHSDHVPPPDPHAVSFGYKKNKVDNNQEQMFEWTGMSSVYINYICCGKALEIFSKFGKYQIRYSSALLKTAMEKILSSKPMLSGGGKQRVMNVLKIQMTDFDYILNGVLGSEEYPCGRGFEASKSNFNGDMIAPLQNLFQAHGVHVSVKVFEKGGCESKLPKSFFLRISAWSYNTEKDFQYLANVLDRTPCFSQEMLLSNDIPSSRISQKTNGKSQKQMLLRHHFLQTWDLTEKLFTSVKTRALFMRAERLRHHLIFYYGHVAVFFVNKLVSGGFLDNARERIDPKFESLFAIGVDEMSWDDLFEDNYDWPIWRPHEAKMCPKDNVLKDPLGRTDDQVLQLQIEFKAKVKDYRDKCKALVLDLIDNKLGTRKCDETIATDLLADQISEHRERQMEKQKILNEMVYGVSNGSTPINDNNTGSTTLKMKRSSNSHGKKTSATPRSSADSTVAESDDLDDDTTSYFGKGNKKNNSSDSTGTLSTQDTLQSSLWWILAMGVEHEKIHIETGSLFIPQLPMEYVEKDPKINKWLALEIHNPRTGEIGKTDEKREQRPIDSIPKNSLVKIPGGTVEFGREGAKLEALKAVDYYGWDNEFGNERKEIQDFEVSKMLVSNKEYLEFIEKGKAYELEGQKYWSEEGWNFVTRMNLKAPRFWLRNSQSEVNENETEEMLMQKYGGKKYTWTHYRTMFHVIPMPWEWPAIVSNLEAEAFCRYKSSQLSKNIRLISHEEHARMREIGKSVCGDNNNGIGSVATNETIATTTSSRTNNINLALYASPTPVDFPQCVSEINGEQVYDLVGNVWRHSCSVLTVLQGFKTHPAYDDFTLPTIDGHHSHILGGSFLSLGNCATAAARYGFRRHFYQFAGIRYVVGNEVNDKSYHQTVPKIFEALPLGKHITENYWSYWRTAPPTKGGYQIENQEKDSKEMVLASGSGPVGQLSPAMVKDVASVTTDDVEKVSVFSSDNDNEFSAFSNAGNNTKLGNIIEMQTVPMGDQLFEVICNDYLHDPTLRPVKNWPVLLGRNAADVIATALSSSNASNNMLPTNAINKEDIPIIRIMVAYGGVGRSTLEMLAELSHLKMYRFEVDYTAPTANTLQVLETLLKQKRLQWYQQIEGQIEELREYVLEQEAYAIAKSFKDVADTNSNTTTLERTSTNTDTHVSNVHINYYQNSGGYLNLRSQLQGPYDFVVADFRYKNAGVEIANLCGTLKPETGMLILGETTDEIGPKFNFKDRSVAGVKERSEEAAKYGCSVESYLGHFPHIYKETVNKHQYSVSRLSVWKKNALTKKDSYDANSAKTTTTQSINHSQSTTQYYEDQQILISYDRFHFNDDPILGDVQNLALTMSQLCLSMIRKYLVDVNENGNCGNGSFTSTFREMLALDAGSGPGRVAIELGQYFGKVEAFDYSDPFVDMMKQKITEKGIKNVIPYQADAHDLLNSVKEPNPEGKFDLIFNCNLIDRLHTPIKFLEDAVKLLKKPTRGAENGGLLIIASPYTWKKEHCKIENWIGGKYRDAEKYFTQDALEEILLAKNCELKSAQKVPFVIPDEDGTFQFTFTNCVVFQLMK